MEKETVTKFNLEAAFKALDEIDMPKAPKGRLQANRVNLHERFQAKSAHDRLIEDYFDVNDVDDLEAAKEEREAEVAKAKLARIEKIVDLDAETEEDILPSYVGKVIMQCPQCMTLFYKNEEDIEKSEETPDVVNINELCQHCGNASGYTLVGKVGGIEEGEAENFDLDDIDVEVDENELNLDFPEEGTEEVDAEGVGEGAEEMSDEDFDFDLDFEEESTEEEEEEEAEEANESLHNSELLDKIEDKNELKTDIESEHLTLNEEFIEDEETEEIIETVETPVEEAEVEDESTEAPKVEKLNENSLTEDAEDALFDELWSGKQPTDAETRATLASFSENVEAPASAEAAQAPEAAQAKDSEPNEASTPEVETERPVEESIEEFEEFDEAFDAHVTNYLQEVYSNIQSYNSINCSISKNKFVVEGIIKFKSGKEKATKFTFNPSRTINGSIIFRGMNEGLTSEKSAFRLACKSEDKKLVTEGFSYKYSIDGAAIKGTTKTVRH
jgi:hypothetical protein